MAGKSRIKLVTMMYEGIEVAAKECSKCTEVKPLELFYKSSDGSLGGRNAQCIECRKAKALVDKPKTIEYRKKYYADNYDEIRGNQRIYWEANKESIRASNNANARLNKESKAIYDEAYSKANRDKINEYARGWYASNIERERERGVIRQAHRRAVIKGLRTGFNADWKELLMTIYEGCILTGEKEDIHWDHFIPLATGEGGSHSGNMVPLQSTLNMSKGAGNPIDFLLDNGISDSRLYDILWVLAMLNDMTVIEYVGYVYECFEEKEVG